MFYHEIISDSDKVKDFTIQSLESKIRTLEDTINNSANDMKLVTELKSQVSKLTSEQSALNIRLQHAIDSEQYWRDECETQKLAAQDSVRVIKNLEIDLELVESQRRELLIRVDAVLMESDSKEINWEHKFSDLQLVNKNLEVQCDQWMSRVNELELSLKRAEKELYAVDELSSV